MLGILNAFWQSGNRVARTFVASYCIFIATTAFVLGFMSCTGWGKLVPWVAVLFIASSIIWLSMYSRLTRGGIGRARYTAGDPLLVLLVGTTRPWRMIIVGIPMLIALYAWIVPMDSHPSWVMGTALSTFGMFIFAGALETDWPWAKVGRWMSIIAFLLLTVGYYHGALKSGTPVPDVLPEADSVHKAKKSASEYVEIVRKGEEAALRAQDTRKSIALVDGSVKERRRQDLKGYATRVETAMQNGTEAPAPPRSPGIGITVTGNAVPPASAKPCTVVYPSSTLDATVRENGEWIEFYVHSFTDGWLTVYRWKRDSIVGTFQYERDDNSRELKMGGSYEVRWIPSNGYWEISDAREINRVYACKEVPKVPDRHYREFGDSNEVKFL